MAAAHGVNLSGVSGTGPRGRIIRADVEDALTAPPSQPEISAPVFDSIAGGDYIDIENSNIRKVIADRLTHSKQNIPHYYITT